MLMLTMSIKGRCDKCISLGEFLPHLEFPYNNVIRISPFMLMYDFQAPRTIISIDTNIFVQL